MAVKRLLVIVAWYLSIGIAVGIETGNHQARRFDPGFAPIASAMAAVALWPVFLTYDAGYFFSHLDGDPGTGAAR